MSNLLANDQAIVPAEEAKTRSTPVRLTRQFVLVILATIVVASVISHTVARFLHIRTGGIGYQIIGNQGGTPNALAEGSSLMMSAIEWQTVSNTVKTTIETWIVAGSSPTEWEVLQQQARDTSLTFVAVSLYDLNEDFLCDYRANVVSLPQTIKDLRSSESDWQFAKRVLSQYPLKYVRLLFPTVGRSDGVMVGLRAEFARLVSPWFRIEAEAGPAIKGENRTDAEKDDKEKLSEWTQARILRRVALMRSACKGNQRFNGPKHLALMRMLERAAEHGKVVVMVLPVSDIYTREMLNPEAIAQFEASLTKVQQAVPAVQWFRLDHTSHLTADENFYDLVHLNIYGNEIATREFVSQLGQTIGR